MLQEVTVPSNGTRNGRLPLSLETWKPVTLAMPRQGFSGQEGSGVFGVSPSTTVTLDAAAPAPLPRTSAAQSASALTAAASPARASGRCFTGTATWVSLDCGIRLAPLDRSLREWEPNGRGAAASAASAP